MKHAESGSTRDRRHNAPFERTFYHLKYPVNALIQHRMASGITLLIAAIVAMFAANSPLSEYYLWFINLPISLKVGGWEMEETLQLWVSDGLMAIFFLAIGLEIKRELLVGELSTPRKAALPVVAALGGIIVPAIIYVAINPHPIESYGWGIPVATDIAFAIGVLALLGERVPRSLYMFLITLAVVDDLAAVLIIALFYTDHIALDYLSKAAVMFAVLVGLNLIGIRRPLPYFIVGTMLWFAMLKSGIHATIAGVLLALTIPARSKTMPSYFSERVHHLIEQMSDILFSYDQKRKEGKEVRESHEQHSIISVFHRGIGMVESPLHKVQDDLRLPIAFIVMPFFAFVNAGVPINLELLTGELSHHVSMGVFFGLLLGKFTGISLASLASIKFGIAHLPGNVEFKHILGASFVAGIGFTMSMFIAGLAFRDTPELIRIAKMGILTGSLIAGSIGYVILRIVFRGNMDEHGLINERFPETAHNGKFKGEEKSDE